MVGTVDDSDTLYPVTPTLSDAASVEMETVRDDAVVGRVKAVIVGLVVSVVTGRVIVTVLLEENETLPAASLAQTYRYLLPAVANVYDVGTVVVQPVAVAVGVVDVSASL